MSDGGPGPLASQQSADFLLAGYGKGTDEALMLEVRFVAGVLLPDPARRTSG